MKKRNSLALCAHARSFVDQLHSRRAAAIERRFEVVHCKADVMNSRAAARNESSNRRFFVVGFEQLHQRSRRIDSGYAGPVRIRQIYLRQSQNSSVKRKRLGNRAHGNSDMRDSRAFRGC